MGDIDKVKKLREATGAGFKDCNLAIKESNGDLDKAIEILRIKGISVKLLLSKYICTKFLNTRMSCGREFMLASLK